MNGTPAPEGLPVSRVKPAYRQVADQLRAQVLTGALAPGERLPNENELSVMFGVGRSTVREALRVLSSQHMVVTSRGVSGGSFVAHPDPASISEFLVASLGLLSGSEVVSFSELLDVRELFEVPAAKLAAEHRTEAQLDHLRAMLDQDLITGDRDQQLEGNLDFHMRLLEAGGNRLLAMMTTPIFTVLHARFVDNGAPTGLHAQLAEHHRLIFERVEAGDGEGASALMAEHLAHLRPLYAANDRIAGS
jgi:GntR family transcriptional regulator, transcriptional repressor for pyruvate dehydrogenase complex